MIWDLYAGIISQHHHVFSLQWSDADRIECHHGTNWESENNVRMRVLEFMLVCCEICDYIA